MFFNNLVKKRTNLQIQAQKKAAPLIAVEDEGKQSDNKMKVFAN